MPPTDATKHARILDAAIDVFAEKGFYRARITDIAERAGVAEGTIYLYFRNKDDVLLNIFEEKMGVLMEGLEQALQGVDDPLDRMRVFARYHFLQVANHPTLAEVLQIELRLSNKFLKEYRPEKLWTYLNVFGQLVREGQARGVVRAGVDPFVASWAFFGALDELAMQWVLRRNNRFSLEQAADTVADIFIRGLCTSTAAAHLASSPVELVPPQVEDP